MKISYDQSKNSLSIRLVENTEVDQEEILSGQVMLRRDANGLLVELVLLEADQSTDLSEVFPIERELRASPAALRDLLAKSLGKGRTAF